MQALDFTVHNLGEAIQMLMNLPEDRSPKVIRFVIEPEKSVSDNSEGDLKALEADLAPFKVDFPIDFKFDREEANSR